MLYSQTLPDFEKNKKLLKLFSCYFLKYFTIAVTWAKYKEIGNFTTDARFSIISDIGS